MCNPHVGLHLYVRVCLCMCVRACVRACERMRVCVWCACAQCVCVYIRACIWITFISKDIVWRIKFSVTLAGRVLEDVEGCRGILEMEKCNDHSNTQEMCSELIGQSVWNQFVKINVMRLIIVKLLGNIIQKPPQIIAENVLPDSQCGFRQGCCCMNIIFTTRQLVKKARKYNYCFLCY